jgi:hypothetical protein
MVSSISNIDYSSIQQALEAEGIEVEDIRTNWIPMTDMTGLIVAIAWKNDEKTAWALFEAEYPEAGHC